MLLRVCLITFSRFTVISCLDALSLKYNIILKIPNGNKNKGVADKRRFPFVRTGQPYRYCIFKNRIPSLASFELSNQSISKYYKHCYGGFVGKSRGKYPFRIHDHRTGRPVLTNGKHPRVLYNLSKAVYNCMTIMLQQSL